MILFFSLVAFTAALAAYVTAVRPLLRKKPWAQGYFRMIEPIERVLYGNSETLLWSRFKALLGTLLTLAVGFDWTSVAPAIPEKYRSFFLMAPTLFLALDGLIGERLRNDTTKPRELVALRTDAPEEVKEAVAEAAEATARAVELAKETGAA